MVRFLKNMKRIIKDYMSNNSIEIVVDIFGKKTLLLIHGLTKIY